MRRRAEPGPPDVEGQLLGRAFEIARTLQRGNLRQVFKQGESGTRAARRASAAQFRIVLEELGPTFAKLGQILSTRPDLIPPEFVDELSHLQEHVTPMPEAQVVDVMEAELGVPWEDVFESIEPTALAAGTIGQVHRATLGSGERVVVKVQRPQAAPDIYRDLGLLDRFARETTTRPVFRQLIDIPAAIEHLSTSLRRELDFRREAANIERMRHSIAGYSRLAVPEVYRELSGPRLLVLEEIQGGPLSSAPPGEARREAARQFVESFYQQILGDGFFHADPHPGNLKWWNDRIYFLDLGMVGEIDPATRELLSLLLMAFWRRDVPFLAVMLLLVAGDEHRSSADPRAVQADLSKVVDEFSSTSLSDIQLGPALQALTEISARNDIRLPASLGLTGKALAQMQIAATQLDPTIDPLALAGSFMRRNLQARARERLDPQQVMYEIQKLRLRAVRLGESVERLTGARPGARLQVDLAGHEELESSIRSAARRFSLALIAGTCIVATGITADSAVVGRWVPTTLGIAGGIVAIGLVADILRRPS